MSGKKTRQSRTGKADEARRILQAFIVELRGILKRKGPALYRRYPNMIRPCHTCAFNPATDSWRGADATAFNLQQAIAKDAPFYCHKGMALVNGEYDYTSVKSPMLCAGWAAIVGEPETKGAFMRAAARVFTSPTRAEKGNP